MLIKRSIYPKTTRFGKDGAHTQITEKLDGSNLGIFVLDDTLWFAQRNTIISYDSLVSSKSAYKGLVGWVEHNAPELLKSIPNGTIIFGEWIGMGHIRYEEVTDKFYMFAKGKISATLDLSHLVYNHDLLHYAFNDQIIPQCINRVPLVLNTTSQVSLLYLDSLYESYCESKSDKVEGFVVLQNGNITKYVRLKGGKLSEHKC